MKNKSKKWKWSLLIIPALMILGIITTILDDMKSDDGIFLSDSQKTLSYSLQVFAFSILNKTKSLFFLQIFSKNTSQSLLS